MSFLDEVKTAVGQTRLKGMDVAFYGNWAGFWKACPLSRPMLIKHGPRGDERLAPERDTPYYQDKFFSGDSFGLVFSQDGTAVAGVVYRRLTPDTVEQTLRVGLPTKGSGLRGALWDLGIRTIQYKIHKQMPKVTQYMDELEAGTDCARTKADSECGNYDCYVTVLKSRPDPV